VFFLSVIVLILLFASTVFLALQYFQLRQDAQERHANSKSAFQLLSRVSDTLAKDLALEPALRLTLDHVIHAVHAHSGAIFLLDESHAHLQARAIRGYFPPLDDTPEHATTRRQIVASLRSRLIDVGRGPIGQVATLGDTLFVRNCQDNPGLCFPTGKRMSLSSLIATPLVARGNVLGVLAVGRTRPDSLFRERDAQRLRALAEQAAVAIDLARLANEMGQQHQLRQELQLAREFQMMLLPKDSPRLYGMELAAYCQPALEIGGDFYDFIPLEKGRMGLVVADVSGKGIPGALIMATARSALRSEARRSMSPREVLSRVNEQILRDTKSNVFITMIYGVLDPNAHTFTYCRAGHEPVLLIPENGNTLPSPTGMALGLVGAELFDQLEEQTLTLSSGQGLLIYTDGVVESVNKNGLQYGRARLSQTAASLPCAICWSEKLQHLVDDVHQFESGTSQQDDMTLLAIARDAQPPLD